MKHLLILFACTSSLLLPAIAKDEKVELPKGSYISPLLERAKADASETHKLLAFLLVNLDTDNKTEVRRSNEFIKAVKDKAVVVQVNLNAPKDTLPAPVVEGLKLSGMKNNYFPRLVLTDATGTTKILAVAPDSNLVDEKTLDFEKTIREVEKAVRPIKPVKPAESEKR